jgi:MYXO-CTERM domain-containing protein
VFAKFTWDGTLRASRFGGTEMLTPEWAAKSDTLKYVNQNFTAIDMTKSLFSSCSSCASAPGGAWLPALVLLAYWLRRR